MYDYIHENVEMLNYNSL